MSANNSSLLRIALYGNSIFSFASGLAFVLFSEAIASFLGISASWIIFVIGAGLLLYGYQLYSSSKSEPVNMAFANIAVYADLVWVLGSAILIFTNLVNFTSPGKWGIAIIADIVLVFAILQYVGLRRIAK
ncbi:MAG TPA: hypothetical protein DCX53_12345 [Anaerolineae bacterium]|nr:hypothetical protein [Anaerolineae bacterium]